MENLSILGYEDYAITRDGRVYSLKSNRFLSLCHNDQGYVVAYLCVSGKTKAVKVHRLVAGIFLKDDYFEGAHVNHLDGNKQNNKVENLEWVNRSQNMRHAFDTGLRPRQLTDLDVERICRLLQDGLRHKDVASMVGVEPHTVSAIAGGKIYKHISSDFRLESIPKNQRLSPEKIVRICEALCCGKAVHDIVTDELVSESTVRLIKNRKIHKTISDSFDW